VRKNMRRSFLWTASIAATVLALVSIGRSAEAYGDRGARYYYYTPRVVVAPGPVMRYRARPLARGRVAGFRAPTAKGPGMCGTYMYWKGGKCNDARLK